MDLIIETVYLSPMTKRHYLKNLRITPPNLLKNISLKSSFLWIDMLLAVFVTIVGLYIIKNGMILSFWHTPNVMSYLKWFWVHRDHWPQAFIAVISVKGILTICSGFLPIDKRRSLILMAPACVSGNQSLFPDTGG